MDGYTLKKRNMAATKDQRKLLNRCIENEVPVFVLTGTDACAMAALNAYLTKAKDMGCNEDFLEDLKTNVIPDFEDFQREENDKVKKPD